MLCWLIIDSSISITNDFLKQTWFLLAGRHSGIKGFSANFDYFDQNVSFGNALSKRKESTTVNESTAAQEVTVGGFDGGSAVNETLVIVKTLQKYFNERIDG